MSLRLRPHLLLAGLALLGCAQLAACGGDNPLGQDEANGPAPVSDDTTTAELSKVAIDEALPSVVAVSVRRGGSTATGTGTVLAKGLVVTDAALVGAPAPTPRPTPRATPAPAATATPAASAGTPTPATTPTSTTPSGTTPASTTPSASPTPKPSTTPRPAPRVAAPPAVSVREASGAEHAATVEGTDPVSGLAVLRVGDLEGVPSAKAGGTPKLGQELASVGYYVARRAAVRPGTVVTTGRLSRKNRETEVGLIEADAPLGVQGIGGPLVDGRGQVVAITTRAITSNVPGAVVAVPYDSTMRIAKALFSSGRVRRAYLGVDTVGITPTRAEELRLSTATGVLVQAIVSGSPASFSTLRGPTGREWIAGRLVPTGSDAITRIDGRPVKEPEDLEAVLATKKPGDRIALRVIRGEKSVVVHVTLGER